MSETPLQPSLLRLAALAGVASSYRDAWGVERPVAAETLAAVLQAMGFHTASTGAIDAASDALEAERWRSLLPPVIVWRHGVGPVGVVLTLSERLNAGRILWSVTGEGARLEGSADPATLAVLDEHGEGPHRHRRLILPIAPVPLGYHELRLAAGHENAETTLIVVPRYGYLPPALTDARRSWGLTAQLYAVRSARNWGMGDLSDLGALAALAAASGAAVLGINPLHALFPALPHHVSPYSSSSRLYLNPLYLDVTAIPDFAECAEAQARVASPEFQTALARVRAAPGIDHAAVAALKQPVFAMLYQAFAAKHLGPDGGPSVRGAAFRDFQRAGGDMLESYGRFNALHARMCAEGKRSWRDWPEGLRDADSNAVASFAATHRRGVEFHHYLEWECDRQLCTAASLGQAAGLEVGFYRDLAISVDPDGAEAWADPSLNAAAATVGAPPDLLNRLGQNWGLAPVNPVMLRRRAYAPFVAALRANMRHAGVLRLDHAMVLKQLYWVPRGASPQQGTYVAYPFEDMLGILALESLRNRCAVIGEDLGTVPEGFSSALNDAGVLSYRVLLFEHDPSGGFLAPERYPRQAAATFSTHDLPTIRGFWTEVDLTWRRRLGQYPNDAAAAADVVQRKADRRLLLEALIAAGAIDGPTALRLLPRDDDPVFAPELAHAVYRFLAMTNSALVLAQIEDACGEEEQANIPGTIDEHPNWRRKLSRTLEEFGSDEAVPAVAAALDRVRRRPG